MTTFSDGTDRSRHHVIDVPGRIGSENRVLDPFFWALASRNANGFGRAGYMVISSQLADS
jgi:hypothetical protein